MNVNRRTLLLGAATTGIATSFSIRTRPANAAAAPQQPPRPAQQKQQPAAPRTQ